MLINPDMAPKYSIYYIGSLLLEALKKESKVHIEDLFECLKTEVDEDLNIINLYLGLDWLYLLSLIRLDGMEVSLNAHKKIAS